MKEFKNTNFILEADVYDAKEVSVWRALVSANRHGTTACAYARMYFSLCLSNFSCIGRFIFNVDNFQPVASFHWLFWKVESVAARSS